jgi:hypothetical protein
MAIQVGFNSTTRKFLAICGFAIGLGSVGLFATTGTATAGSWPADPTWPAPPSWASYPAPPAWGTYPAPPAWGSYPVDPSWPGDSSHPCCSR